MLQWVVISALIGVSLCYPKGAPESSCATRSPDPEEHGAPPATSECPFIIFAQGWKSGEFTEMALFPKDENSTTQFKGFLISVQYNDKNIGEMNPTLIDSSPKGATAKTVCDGTSLTHTNAEAKDFIHFSWKAPTTLDASASVMIRYTVVEEKEKYWVDCNPFSLDNIKNTATTPDSSGPVAPSTEQKTEAPTAPPTAAPTAAPTERPTEAPTAPPTAAPTEAVTEHPTEAPTAAPTEHPTEHPTEAVTEHPTEAPTAPPTAAPTERPTDAPTEHPTYAAIDRPTEATTAASPTYTTATVQVNPPPQHSENHPAGAGAGSGDGEGSGELPRGGNVTPSAQPEAHEVNTPPQASGPQPAQPPASPPAQASGPQPAQPPAIGVAYHGGSSQSHQVVDGATCTEAGNTYRIKPNTNCRQFYQEWDSSSQLWTCPTGTMFDSNLCTCIWPAQCKV